MSSRPDWLPGLDRLAWLAGADERLLWAILAATVLAAVLGAVVGWRARAARDETREL